MHDSRKDPVSLKPLRSASLAVSVFLALAPAVSGAAQEKKSTPAEPKTDPLIQAYAMNNYSRVRTLGAERKNEPLAALLLSLAKVYDKSQSEAVTKRGVEELGLYFADKSKPKAFRVLAGLSYARCAQLMQDRKDIYGNFADGINHRKVYDEILKMVPDSKEAVAAFLYKNPTSEEIDAYVRTFTGDRQYLIPLHLYIANKLIREKQDYKKAVGHLKQAYNNGIVHPSIRRGMLFRIGYLYDKRLNDYKAAEPYYKEFIKQYPLSTQAVVIQRFMRERGAK